MRFKHCIKNLLILLPLVFNGSLFNTQKTVDTLLGVLSFSFLASSIYIINDIEDCEKDRLHPKKKRRPIASGEVSIKEAIGLLTFALIIAIFLNCLAGANVGSFICLFVYFGLNVIYSKGLKNIPIVDIVILTSGFVIRVIYGGQIANIHISGWLYLTIITASLYLGMGKRRNELGKTEDGTATRGVLKYHNFAFLDKNMYMCFGLAEAFYALWAMDTGNDVMLWSVPLVIM